MLKQFSVYNFKNFNNEITLDFSDVRDYKFNNQCIKNQTINKMIIYGRNSIGKTNFGLAIFDLSQHLVDKVNTGNYLNYINADRPDSPAKFSYKFCFDGTIVDYVYEKTDAKTLVSEEFIVNGRRMFKYDFSSFEGDFDGIEYFDSVSSLNLNFKDNKLSVLRYIANNSILEDNSPIKKVMNFVSNMLWFKSEGEKSSKAIGLLDSIKPITSELIRMDKIKEFQKFLLENGIDEKLIIRKDPTGEQFLYSNHKRPLKFVDTFSSGTAALTLFFYLSNYFSQASFVYIDEFDSSFHYELAENIVKILQSQDGFQTILTSHNTNLLSNSIMRPDCYFILSKESLTSIANATERELREGHNLEKLYIGGEFSND